MALAMEVVGAVITFPGTILQAVACSSTETETVAKRARSSSNDDSNCTLSSNSSFSSTSSSSHSSSSITSSSASSTSSTCSLITASSSFAHSSLPSSSADVEDCETTGHIEHSGVFIQQEKYTISPLNHEEWAKLSEHERTRAYVELSKGVTKLKKNMVDHRALVRDLHSKVDFSNREVVKHFTVKCAQYASVGIVEAGIKHNSQQTSYSVEDATNYSTLKFNKDMHDNGAELVQLYVDTVMKEGESTLSREDDIMQTPAVEGGIRRPSKVEYIKSAVVALILSGIFGNKFKWLFTYVAAYTSYFYSGGGVILNLIGGLLGQRSTNSSVKDRLHRDSDGANDDEVCFSRNVLAFWRVTFDNFARKYTGACHSRVALHVVPIVTTNTNNFSVLDIHKKSYMLLQRIESLGPRHAFAERPLKDAPRDLYLMTEWDTKAIEEEIKMHLKSEFDFMFTHVEVNRAHKGLCGVTKCPNVVGDDLASCIEQADDVDLFAKICPDCGFKNDSKWKGNCQACSGHDLPTKEAIKKQLDFCRGPVPTDFGMDTSRNYRNTGLSVEIHSGDNSCNKQGFKLKADVEATYSVVDPIMARDDSEVCPADMIYADGQVDPATGMLNKTMDRGFHPRSGRLLQRKVGKPIFVNPDTPANCTSVVQELLRRRGVRGAVPLGEEKFEWGTICGDEGTDKATLDARVDGSSKGLENCYREMGLGHLLQSLLKSILTLLGNDAGTQLIHRQGFLTKGGVKHGLSGIDNHKTDDIMRCNRHGCSRILLQRYFIAVENSSLRNFEHFRMWVESCRKNDLTFRNQYYEHVVLPAACSLFKKGLRNNHFDCLWAGIKCCLPIMARTNKGTMVRSVLRQLALVNYQYPALVREEHVAFVSFMQESFDFLQENDHHAMKSLMPDASKKSFLLSSKYCHSSHELQKTALRECGIGENIRDTRKKTPTQLAAAVMNIYEYFIEESDMFVSSHGRACITGVFNQKLGLRTAAIEVEADGLDQLACFIGPFFEGSKVEFSNEVKFCSVDEYSSD